MLNRPKLCNNPENRVREQNEQQKACPHIDKKETNRKTLEIDNPKSYISDESLKSFDKHLQQFRWKPQSDCNKQMTDVSRIRKVSRFFKHSTLATLTKQNDAKEEVEVNVHEHAQILDTRKRKAADVECSSYFEHSNTAELVEELDARVSPYINHTITISRPQRLILSPCIQKESNEYVHVDGEGNSPSLEIDNSSCKKDTFGRRKRLMALPTLQKGDDTYGSKVADKMVSPHFTHSNLEARGFGGGCAPHLSHLSTESSPKKFRKSVYFEKTCNAEDVDGKIHFQCLNVDSSGTECQRSSNTAVKQEDRVVHVVQECSGSEKWVRLENKRRMKHVQLFKNCPDSNETSRKTVKTDNLKPKNSDKSRSFEEMIEQYHYKPECHLNKEMIRDCCIRNVSPYFDHSTLAAQSKPNDVKDSPCLTHSNLKSQEIDGRRSQHFGQTSVESSGKMLIRSPCSEKTCSEDVDSKTHFQVLEIDSSGIECQRSSNTAGKQEDRVVHVVQECSGSEKWVRLENKRRMKHVQLLNNCPDSNETSRKTVKTDNLMPEILDKSRCSFEEMIEQYRYKPECHLNKEMIRDCRIRKVSPYFDHSTLAAQSKLNDVKDSPCLTHSNLKSQEIDGRWSQHFGQTSAESSGKMVIRSPCFEKTCSEDVDSKIHFQVLEMGWSGCKENISGQRKKSVVLGLLATSQKGDEGYGRKKSVLKKSRQRKVIRSRFFPKTSKIVDDNIKRKSLALKYCSNGKKKKPSRKKKSVVLKKDEKFSEAYRRKTADNDWKPPYSHGECGGYPLLQEEHAHDPWRVLVICMLLNSTGGNRVRECLAGLFTMCPDAKTTTEVGTSSIENVIHTLGLQEKRSEGIQRLAREYLDESWTHVTQLYSVGKYAADAYAIFCTGQWEKVKPNDHKLNEYWEFLHRHFNKTPT